MPERRGDRDRTRQAREDHDALCAINYLNDAKTSIITAEDPVST